MGFQALGVQNFTAATAAYNVAVGMNAGLSVTTGTGQTLIGGLAGDAITTSSNNTCIGYLAGTAISTGDGNSTCVGVSSGANLTTGSGNTLIGASAGNLSVLLQTGDNNTVVGTGARTSSTSVDSEIVLGYNITGAGGNTVRIGTSTGGTATLNLDGSDTSWAAASDQRLKKDVADSTVGLSFINALRPVTFKWNSKNAIADDLPQYDKDSSDPVYGEGKAHHGFIAQEVKTVIDANSDVVDGHNIWNEDPEGTQQLAPASLIPMLVKAIQELSAEVETLKSGG